MARTAKLTLVLLLNAITSALAAPNRFRVYPNPDIAVRGIAESPEGTLWLATGEGAFRFDGSQYTRVPGVPIGSPDVIAATNDGSVWIGGIEGLVRCRATCAFVIRNEHLSSLVSVGDALVAQGAKLYRIAANGSVQTGEAIGGKVLFPAPDGAIISANSSFLRVFDARTFRELRKMPVDRSYQITAAAADAKGRMWIMDWNRAESLEKGGPVYAREVRKNEPIVPLTVGRNGELWFLGDAVQGLVSGIVYRGPPAHDAFRATTAYEDKRGHLWVARRGLGLVEWARDAGWENWYSDSFAGETIEQVTRATDGSIIAVGRHLYRLKNDGKWEALDGEDRPFDYVLPQSDGGYLAAIRKIGLARLDARGALTGEFPSSVANRTDDREILRDKAGQIWVGGKTRLQRLDVSNTLEIVELPHTEHSGTAHAVDLEMDSKGRLWVGYSMGIAWFENNQPHLLDLSEPVTGIRTITISREDKAGEPEEIWVAHRSKVPFTRVKRVGQTWEVTRFASEAGYGPGETMYLKRDSRGWIWRGTRDGVYISDGRHLRPKDWIHITTASGLATDETDQYGFFEDRDGSVWIAGVKGVSHLHPDAGWFASSARHAPGLQLLSQEWWLFPIPFGAAFLWLFRRHVWLEGMRMKLEYLFFPLRERLFAGGRAVTVVDSGEVDRSGQVLGKRYQVTKPVSRAGFSVVYCARDSQTGEVVALKALRQQVGKEHWLRERFAQEIAALTSTHHRGVVRITDWWIEPDGTPCLVMPFLDGPRLSDILDQGPLAPGRVARLVVEIGDALAELHGRGVVHRDLKPDNILLLGPPAAEQPVIIDFGTAAMRGSVSENSATAVLSGSTRYMAPERYLFRYSAASDLFAFGIIILEMLASMHPIEMKNAPSESGFEEELAACFAEVLGDRSAGERLAGCLAPALAATPAARPGDVRAWAGRIARILLSLSD
jgi:ligand-binding sensor domain-containing protein